MTTPANTSPKRQPKTPTTAEADNLVKFGHEAVESSPHRRPPRRTIKTDDFELDRTKRKMAGATIRDEARSAGLLTWMIRRHLDYVSRFEIGFRSPSDELNAQVLGLLAWHRRRKNWDISSRHNRDQWMRIFECNKVLAGDAAGIMTNLGSMQGLDSEQIGPPDDFGAADNATVEKLKRVTPHGLLLGEYNQVVEYCICSLNSMGRRVFDHFEPAASVVFDGYFGGSFNQTRGISPILAAINDVIDQRDIVLYTKINLKLKNLFGIAIFREGDESLGEDDDTGIGQQEWTPDRVNVLDLDTNDKVDSIESANTPSANAIEFMHLLARISFTALDIPYTSFDSSRASFSARIADRAEYEASAESKRQKNADILREIYAWRVAAWYESLPDFRQAADRAGWSVGRIVEHLDPMPACTPWMDRVNELRADALAVALGTESIPRLCRKRGLDAYEVGAEQAEYLAWAKSKGIPIFYAAGGQDAVQNIIDEGREVDEDENE